MNGGLEKLWKKWGVAYIQVLFQLLPGRTEREDENFQSKFSEVMFAYEISQLQISNTKISVKISNSVGNLAHYVRSIYFNFYHLIALGQRD
jgi:hypothetical protein